MSLLGRQLQKIQQQIKKQIDRRRISDILFATVKRGKITFDELTSLINLVKSIKLTCPFVVGEKVKDDLTREEHIVIGISYMNGRCENKKFSHYHCWGIWIDSDYAGGARHPWELTKL